jgi:hypothetical protein
MEACRLGRSRGAVGGDRCHLVETRSEEGGAIGPKRARRARITTETTPTPTARQEDPEMDLPVPEEFPPVEERGFTEDSPAGGFHRDTGDIRTTTILITVVLVGMKTPTHPAAATPRTTSDSGLGVVPPLEDLVSPASDPIRHLSSRT